MKQNSLTLRLTALVVLILIPLTACGIRPNKILDRDIVGTLESDTQIELVSDFTGPESVEPVTIPETGAPIETASPIIVPETVYSEETSAETDPFAVGSLPDYSHIWEFKPDPPEFYSKYPVPDEFFLSDLSVDERQRCETDFDYEAEHYCYILPIETEIEGLIPYHPIYSILGEPGFIKDHTVGFYLIQNKQSGSFLTRADTVDYLTDPEHFRWTGWNTRIGLWNQDISNTNMAGAQIVRIVQLDNGCYAMYFSMYSTARMTDTVFLPCFSLRTGILLADGTSIAELLDQSMVIQKTASGAFRITSLYRDSVQIEYSEQVENNKYLDKSYFGTLIECDDLSEGRMLTCGGPYTNDADYSDEWLFIPVKGSPEFNP